jgi:hypothetical protein
MYFYLTNYEQTVNLGKICKMHKLGSKKLCKMTMIFEVKTLDKINFL